MGSTARFAMNTPVAASTASAAGLTASTAAELKATRLFDLFRFARRVSAGAMGVGG